MSRCFGFRTVLGVVALGLLNLGAWYTLRATGGSETSKVALAANDSLEDRFADQVQPLARHRDNKSCAGCHRRFDSLGLVFEAFGPIGERREKDLGGRPVATMATFPDGSDREGLNGLRAYLREQRQDEFVENLCRKLFAYALGRGLLLSDREALDKMRTWLAGDGYAFGSLVEAIVTSPQFLNKRGRDDPRGQ
jgi:hypothetical protein